MKNIFLLGLLFSFSMSISAQETISIIPQPNKITLGTGDFVFSHCTRMDYPSGLQAAVDPLLNKIKTAAGLDLLSKNTCQQKSLLSIRLDKNMESEEGYDLQIQPEKIVLKAKTAAGIFYGVQTLLQLLPPAIEDNKQQPGLRWSVPCLSIQDQPRFEYRGLMLDVARHYMPIPFLQKMIDLMAMQKMNRFHLHLTDSQGWRFESKKYPKLTQVGAYRKGDPLHTTYDYQSRPGDSLYGGYYTQEQLRALVRYAQDRFITIVPEIEMPAHSMSALASYPELACVDSSGHPFPYPQKIQDEYCTKDATFEFLDNILTEVMDIFPGQYIHVAGDEASKENWKTCPYCQQRIKSEGLHNVDELQSYFVRRIEKFVNSHGRQIIGWDEILQGGLAPHATVMSWTGIDGGIQAARQHHPVVMTPGAYCYLDHLQAEGAGEPLNMGGLLTLATVYGYDPVPRELSAGESGYIKGTQGNLWTEFVPNPARAEYMYFPRALALAEIGWTEPAEKSFENFVDRLSGYFQRLDIYRVNYSRHLFDIRSSTSLQSNHQVTVALTGVTKEYPLHYTLDGSLPTEQSPLYTSPVPIRQDGTLHAAVLMDGKITDQITKSFQLHKAVGKPIHLLIPPDKPYNLGGNNAWVNGALGSDRRFADDEWLGWEGKIFDGTIDMEVPTETSSLQTRFFHVPNSWVWMAKKVKVLVSEDGIQFTTVAEKEIPLPSMDGPIPFSLSWPKTTARFLRIVAEPQDRIPVGNPGAGEKAWIFVDEMVIH